MTTPVFVLAAGLGTRLRPLTEWLPKPLLPVGDRPALAHVLDRVRGLGGRVAANAHHRADDLRAFLEGYAPDVHLVVEADLLGTAGGLANAADALGAGSVLVWNGDILADVDPEALVAAHHAHRDARATLVVEPLLEGEGNVGLATDGRLVRLRRETVAPGEVRGGSFLGVHVVGEGLRATLPVTGCLVGDVYLPALRSGQTLRAFEVAAGSWHDIGTLGDYRAAHASWLRSRGIGSFVAPDAQVSPDVTLRDAVVGAGAVVLGAGVLEDCIVWPGSRVTLPQAPAVVTPWGRVPFRE